ncbi:Endonuclease MutS2 [Arenibacter antarcticus]|uniref:Smr/MutS family protein n=1 Tax=Arenibacter antarcticus TaxID=2040469 RepID=A0ABW5VJ16_9FLAO|nr:Smr/MutS family protein [Arenibacter sp. H213]MCM4168960.1 DNA mismatch repair protein MutS [Arenibacter sp. H213]
MDFKKGDKVEAIDDTVSGTIVRIEGEEITVESTDGFLLKYSYKELLSIPDDQEISVSNFEVAQIKAEKEVPKRRNRPVSKPKERNAPKMEIDLHIEKLTTKAKGMSNFDIMNIQLETAKRQLDFAMRKRIQKVVFIHGVGEGVLKEELYYLFRKYENVKYYDADYQKYGMGATEVYFYQN